MRKEGHTKLQGRNIYNVRATQGEQRDKIPNNSREGPEED